MNQWDATVPGKVIRRERKRRRMSQEVVSGLAGIARSHLSMIESGDKQANFYTIWRIAQAMGMRPSELVRLFEEYEQQDGNTN